jgi:DNA helicase HerA-like ATPase
MWRWLVAVAVAFLSVVAVPDFAGAMRGEPIAVQPPSATRVAVAGVTDMGKSHWVRAYARDIRRLLVWDPERDWSGEHRLGGGRISLEELVERTRAHRYDSGVLRIAVRPTWRKPLKEDFEVFCRCARRIGALTTVVEEVSNVASPNSVGLQFNRLIVAGRHRGVSLVVVGQRYAQFPRAATGNANLLVTFQQSENADVDYLRERLGDVADQVRHLEPRHFVTWTPTGGVHLHQPLARAA